MSPLPADYDSAITEILRLRAQLQRQNTLIAKHAERNELIRRSMVGQVKKLQAELNALRGVTLE